MNYRISRSATRDLYEIGLYTLREWGQNQADLYVAALETRIRWLAGNRPLWRQRPDIAERVFSYTHERHIIVFMDNDDCLDVIRVLHQRMDLQELIDDT